MYINFLVNIRIEYNFVFFAPINLSTKFVLNHFSVCSIVVSIFYAQITGHDCNPYILSAGFV